MRHRLLRGKFARTSQHRKAMLRNMAQSLIEHGRITTTLPKAKALRPYVEKLITLARKGGLHNRRLALSTLSDREIWRRDAAGEEIYGGFVVKRLFDVIGPLFATRPGGYTRIIHLSDRRAGDNAPMAIIELVETPQDILELRAARESAAAAAPAPAQQPAPAAT